MGKIHNEQESYSREMGLDQVIAYTGSNAIYIGLAFPGADKASAVWQIKKLSYDGLGNMTELRYADATDDFKKVWNDRASYDYAGI
uniref:Uncharacterized protein n=1 Tax=viral metagenome TaxID=1070528 RepID=A0A6M3IVP4_9ZZZZ